MDAHVSIAGRNAARMDRYHRLVVYEDGESFGRDPRTIPLEEWVAEGFEKKPLLSAIREKCLECCCAQPSEVRKCVSIDCALWPYRMKTNPFRTGRPTATSFRKAANGEEDE